MERKFFAGHEKIPKVTEKWEGGAERSVAKLQQKGAGIQLFE